MPINLLLRSQTVNPLTATQHDNNLTAIENAVNTNTTNIATNTSSISSLQSTVAAIIKPIGIAISDETTALTTGTAKTTFRMPFAYTLSSIKASLTTAQSTGLLFTVDVKKNGVSVFSTLLTFDNTETTTKTAVTPAVLSTTALADDDVITVDITQIGDGTAKGLKIWLLGTSP